MLVMQWSAAGDWMPERSRPVLNANPFIFWPICLRDNEKVDRSRGSRGKEDKEKD